MSRDTLRWGTTLRLATIGSRADRTRIALTAVGAATGTLTLLAAVTVAVTGADNGSYTSDLLNQPGLHPGIVLALVLLCVPVLAFTGQCARLGAPSRDRRLATMRLIGATPTEVNRVAATETGLAALVGSLLGLGVYATGRILLSDPVVATYEVTREQVVAGGLQRITEEVTGPALRLPTDVLPPAWTMIAIVAGLPLVVTGAALLALRRVQTTPFGLIRHEQVRPVRAVSAVLFLVGSLGLALFTSIFRITGLDQSSEVLVAAAPVVLFLLTAVGLVLGTAAIASALGRLLASRTSRPALLIAGRRLAAAPYAASRANAALLVVVFLAAAGQGYRAWLLAATAEHGTDFYADAMGAVNLAFLVAGVVAAAAVLVAMAERAVTGRRTVAALAATGVPRGVLTRAVFLEVILPVLPAALLAAAGGLLAVRGFLGTTVPTGPQRADGTIAEVLQPVPIPWTGLTVVLGATALALLLTAAVAAAMLRLSADPQELRTT